MAPSTPQQDDLKRQAAEKAVESVKDGMVVGLGTGSTSRMAVDAIGRRVKEEGLRIQGIPTSEVTAAQATSLGIPLTDLGSVDHIDVTIDGADAVDPADLSLIKGLGGALLREKIVASASRKMIVIVDESKLAGKIGSRTPVPVEIVRFGWQSTNRKLVELGCTTVLRKGAANDPFVTDGGNYILDCHFEAIGDAPFLEKRIAAIPGVVESGLFIGLATQVIVAKTLGIEILPQL